MLQTVPVTIVETPEFLAASSALMEEADRMLLVDYLAAHPASGDLTAQAGCENCGGRCKDAESAAAHG